MNHAYAVLGIASLTLFPVGSHAQVEGGMVNRQFEEAGKLMEEKLYNQAAEVWLRLVKNDPENGNLQYKLGYAYFHSYNQRSKALPHLEKASMLRKGDSYGSFNNAGYDPFDPRERNPPAEVDYYLGRAYHLINEFDKADMYYQRFLDNSDARHDLRPMAERGKQQTANARTLRAAPLPYQISNVGNVINSDYPDFSPVLSVDGNALFFTSRRERKDTTAQFLDPMAGIPYENIYVSYKDRQGNWQAPERLNINPRGPGHLASVNVSADGQTLFIYRDDSGDGNLYESKLVGETWTEPVLMGSDINTKAWESHGALSADGSTFFFVSDRKGGTGGRDIYRVVKLPNGEWSKAQNVGPAINTPYDEDGVFFHPDGRTMYFGSVGHNSMGGFDIFVTELQDDGSWSKPTNLGHPLNTVDDDVFFITTADGRRGYFSSDQIGGFGEKDIYFIDLPSEMEAEGLAVLKGFIIPPPGQPLPPNVVLYVTDKTTGEVRAYRPRARDGVYVAILKPCREYNLDYRVNDVTVHSEDIFVECESAYQEINKEVYLKPLDLGGADVVTLPPGYPPGGKLPDDQTVDGTKPTTTGKTPTTGGPEGTGRTGPAPDGSYVDEFQKFYAYNVKDIDQGEARWKQFIDVVAGLIEKNGSARIVLEASASKVPTRTFRTNENLSRQRMEDARKRLVEAVKARGLDPNKLKLEAVNSLVQGPRYAGDYKDTEKYGKYQYVKLKVR